MALEQTPSTVLPATVNRVSQMSTDVQSIVAVDPTISSHMPGESGVEPGLIRHGHPQAGRSPPKIIYKVLYKNNLGQLLRTRKSESPIAHENLPSKERPILEIRTSVISPLRQSEIDFEDEIESEDENEALDEDRAGGTVMKIYSQKLINAIRSVVEYYPTQALMHDRLTIAEPYPILVHHMEELEAYKSQQGMGHSAEYIRESNEHIDVLLGFLRENFKDALELERERHRRDPPVCTYDYLWLLYKPGSDIYIKLSEAPEPFVVGGVSITMRNGRPKSYDILNWAMRFDGDVFGRESYSSTMPSFDGEKEISTLLVYPKRFHKEDLAEQGGTLLEEMMINRGKTFFRVVRGSCMDYAGETLSSPNRKYESRIIIDHEMFYAEFGESPSFRRPNLATASTENFSFVKGCHCEFCRQRKEAHWKSKFADYDKINPNVTKKLTTHQYFLLPRSIYAFVLKVRTWQHLDIQCVQEPKFDPRAMNSLVMEESSKNLIKALSRRFTQQTSSGSNSIKPPGDFIEGKGEGRIFLLHGSPGVGKTCTAECISEYTQRPLLSLTVSDLGINPETVEDKLRQFFKYAKKWGAILLLDEADLYLEKRVSHDLKRNSLVSGTNPYYLIQAALILTSDTVFLRALEYYQGILILTTNRVGTFDDAFTSRIHVILYYRDLTEEDRAKIWTNHIQRLDNEKEGKIKVPYATREYVTESREMKEVKWNGREIRNGFQTAVALAEFEAAENNSSEVKLYPHHLQAVVNMSKPFKDYLSSTHKGFDEARRAKHENIRDDSFGSPKTGKMRLATGPGFQAFDATR